MRTKKPNELYKGELASLVLKIQEALWYDWETQQWDKDKVWPKHTLDQIAIHMAHAGLMPKKIEAG